MWNKKRTKHWEIEYKQSLNVINKKVYKISIA